ncbi:hypothetical protein [Shimia sp.]|uniref:hypothetical protein n=1 Tax=Shimia sp. TaxID=1954381 RepID=UPI003BA8EB0A
MALALFIPGSIAGFIIGLIQVFVLGAGVWTGIATYFGFSLGFPLAVFALTYLACALRRSEDEREEITLHKA